MHTLERHLWALEPQLSDTKAYGALYNLLNAHERNRPSYQQELVSLVCKRARFLSRREGMVEVIAMLAHKDIFGVSHDNEEFTVRGWDDLKSRAVKQRFTNAVDTFDFLEAFSKKVPSR